MKLASSLMKFDIKYESNKLPVKKVSGSLQNLLFQKQKSVELRREFKQQCLCWFRKVVENLKYDAVRFPLKYDAVQHLRCLDPREIA